MNFPESFEDLVTNENLEAIVKGLNIQKTDKILTTCGAGDQAFAFAEKANEITIIDLRKRQVDFFLYRKELLKSEKFSEFCDSLISGDGQDMESLYFRDKYFTDKRLKKISLRLKDIKIILKPEKDIFDTKYSQKFDKIYLSNSITYGRPCISKETYFTILNKIGQWLKTNGLVYVSQLDKKMLQEDNYLNNLRFNLKLTSKAQKLQSKMIEWDWSPAVFQKV